MISSSTFPSLVNLFFNRGRENIKKNFAAAFIFLVSIRIFFFKGMLINHVIWLLFVDLSLPKHFFYLKTRQEFPSRQTND